MFTIEDARKLQKKEQNKSLIVFLLTLIILSGICTSLYFAGNKEFNIGIYLSLFILVYVAYKKKLYEFFLPRECEGTVIFFNVHEERFKENHTHQAGSKYATYGILFADISITDKKGKTRHKTFRFYKEYDGVKVGDKAIFLRFVDNPIIRFQK